MEDSFFGFDTSIPYDEDGGGQIEEPSEEEYDALNDETFGSAINTDWEEAHESMVRLDDNIGDGDIVVQRGNIMHNSSNRSRSSRIYNNDNLIDFANNSSGETSPASMLRSAAQNKILIADSDLELNLSNMKLEEVDIRFNDNTNMSSDLGAISMDPGVWSTNPMQATKLRQNLYNFGNNNSLFSNNDHYSNGLSLSARNTLNESFLNHKQQQQQHQSQQQTPTQQSLGLPQLPASSKICTLEDIERNILGQLMQKQKQTLPQQQQQQPQPIKPPTPIQHLEQIKAQLQQKGSLLVTPHSPSRPNNNLINLPTHQQNQAQHPLLQQQHQQQQLSGGNTRLPPGFPPIYPPGFPPQLPPSSVVPPTPPVHHQLLAQHGLPLNFQHGLQRPQLPIALNNFAMHPTFSPMRAASATTMNLLSGAQQQQQQQQQQHQQQQQQQINLLNMRMMQEIQQNHPMLQQQRPLLQQMQQHYHQQQMQQHHQQQQDLQRQILIKQQQQQQIQQLQHRYQHNNRANGNLPQREFDEYANLMSTRDKHWLIGIQLSQLNVDTPYIDDFYYTVYKERAAELKGEMRNSQAHKDNQLNHPLIQPRGHAQLILVQLGNKNGTRNGQHRERRNSDANVQNNNNNREQQEKTPYVFTPMKFENSLGKLQYGSVTAPRKIIDADIMGSENAQLINGSTAAVRPKTPAITSLGVANYTFSGTGGGNMTLIQHKTRDLLLHIETLYRIVLKLEDLQNPAALQSIALKKKKEAERLAAMEQQENANKTVEELANAQNDESVQTKPKYYYEIEPEDELLETLISGLTMDRIVAMMNVRKGKILIRRALPFISENNMRLKMWIAIFQALQTVVKKDRDDSEGTLYALYPAFKKQISCSDFSAVMRLAQAMTLKDKKSDGIFCNRFGISALVCLIARAEKIYTLGIPDKNNLQQWSEFLNQMATSLNRTIQNQTICAAIESDSIQPLMNHVTRFKDLKLDALLALIDKAKKQIN